MSKFNHIIKIFFLRGGGIVLSFAIHPVLAKSLAQSEYGKFVFYQGIFTIFGLVFQYGLSKIIIRDFGALYSTRSLIGKFLFFQLILCLLIVASLKIFADVIDDQYLIYVIPISFLISSLVITTSSLRSKMFINRAILFENIIPYLMILVGIMFFNFLNIHWELKNILQLFIYGFAFSFILSFFNLRGKERSLKEQKESNIVDLIKSGCFLLCIELVFVAYNSGLVAYAKLVDSFENIAFLGVAMKLSDLILLPSRFLIAYVDPALSHSIHKEKNDEIQVIIHKYSLLAFFLALIGCTLFIVLGHKLLKFGFGSNYEKAYGLLVILSVSKLLGPYIAGYAQSVVIMLRHEKPLFRLEFKSVILLSIATVILGYFYGVLGVCIGYSIGAFYRYIYLKFLCQKLTSINPTVRLLGEKI